MKKTVVLGRTVTSSSIHTSLGINLVVCDRSCVRVDPVKKANVSVAISETAFDRSSFHRQIQKQIREIFITLVQCFKIRHSQTAYILILLIK